MSHAAEHGGYVVVQRGDEAELPDRLADRVWLAARVLSGARATGADSPEHVRSLLRCARAWSCWMHLGCDYGPEVMQRVRQAHGSAHAPRTAALR